MKPNKLPDLGQWILFLSLIFGYASQAHASDFRFLAGFGYGGAGITQTQTTSGLGTVQRSEGPGVATIAVERIMGEHFTLAFDHSRGFRLGPFSSGVAFTGFSARYYFMDAVPWGSKETKDETTIFVRRPHFFAGAGAGVADGTIERSEDVVKVVSASGIYAGIRIGADVPMNPHGFGLRPELASSFTLIAGKIDPAKLSLLSIGCSVYFQF